MPEINNESDLQDAIAKWLKEQGIPFYRARMDKESTGPVGWPDFGIFKNGKCLFIETKFEKGPVSKDQKKCHAELAAAGCKVHVTRDLAVTIELIRAWHDTLGQALVLQDDKVPGGNIGIMTFAGHGDYVVQLTNGEPKKLRRATISDLGTMKRFGG